MGTTYYEVEYFVPGDRLKPQNKYGEWWKATGNSVGMLPSQFNWGDAQAERESYRKRFGYKTRLIEVKISAGVVEEDG